MTEFTDKKSLMDTLAPLDPAGRAAILYTGNNRALARSTGANVTFYTGNTIDGARLLVTHRQKKDGRPDGIGPCGGMSERTQDRAAFDRLSQAEREALSHRHDDIVPDRADGWTLTTDDRVIALHTAARETREELQDVGIDLDGFPIDFTQMARVDLPGLREDNYLLRDWDGKSQPGLLVYAADPLCHIMKLPPVLFDDLAKAPQTPVPEGEVAALSVMPLREALGRWSGRHDRTHDFRYPHEWVNNWAIAAKLLGHAPDALVALAADIQGDTAYAIDFAGVAAEMQLPLTAIDTALGAPHGTAARMQAAMAQAYAPRALDNRPSLALS